MKTRINKKWMLDSRQIKKYNLKQARINKEKQIKFLTQQPIFD
jgi:hypothetical protein